MMITYKNYQGRYTWDEVKALAINLFIVMDYPYQKRMFDFLLIWNAKFILFYILQIHSFSITVQELFFLYYTKFHQDCLFLKRRILKKFTLETELIHKLRNPLTFTNSFLFNMIIENILLNLKYD
jgi:hypothetical protein